MNITTKEIYYIGYLITCKKNGFKVQNETEFYNEIIKRGFIINKTIDDEIIEGLTLTDEMQDEICIEILKIQDSPIELSKNDYFYFLRKLKDILIKELIQ